MRFLYRLFSSCAIRIGNDGKVACMKGKISHRTLREIESLAAEAGLRDGEIWIDRLQRLTFSPAISPRLHQQLRNVIGMASDA